jgi:integrase/recombinase XerD
MSQSFRHFQYPTSPEHADLALKEQTLARTAPTEATASRYQPTDAVLAFLDSL